MKKKLILAVLVLTAVTVRAQPFAAGLQTPSRMIFTQQGNVLVAESGTTTSNSGRISFIDRTAIDVMPLGGGRTDPILSVRDAAGVELRSVARPFPANWFSQFTEDLTGGLAGPNHSVVISVDCPVIE